jgi:hypothetical protein
MTDSSDYVKAALEAQKAYAANLDALLQAAAPAFIALDFEAEPSRFQSEQRRNAP